MNTEPPKEPNVASEKKYKIVRKLIAHVPVTIQTDTEEAFEDELRRVEPFQVYGGCGPHGSYNVATSNPVSIVPAEASSAAADEVGRLRAELKTAIGEATSAALALHDALAECRVLAREVEAWRQRSEYKNRMNADSPQDFPMREWVRAGDELLAARTATDASGAMKHPHNWRAGGGREA